MASEEQKDEQEQKKEKSVKIIAGLSVVVCLVCVAVGIKLFGGHKELAVETDSPTVGVVDMQQAFKAHRLYGRLVSLEDQARALAAELQNKPLKLNAQAPKADQKLLDEATLQKQNLEISTLHSKKMEEFQARAEAVRDRLQPQFRAEMSDLDNEYSNRILNLKIKADNAEAMGLSSESRQLLIDEYKRLHDERETRREKLAADQQERLNQQIEAEISADKLKLQEELSAIRKRTQSQALQKQLQIQDKNADALNKALEPIQQQKLNAKKKAMLAAKLTEIKLVKQQIYNDIAGRAAKLAVIYHLTLIVANPIDNLRGMEYEQMGIQPWTELRSPVIGINTLDITEELLKEIKSIQE